MALPADITLVTVTALYLAPDGSAAVGTVTFTPSITPATDGTIVPAPVTVTLEDGALSVELAATDDADWAAPGWTYLVTERITGARVRSYSIVVPAASPTLDLALVAPVVSPTAVTPYLLASQLAAPLGVASLDAGGQVPLSQLGNAPGGGGGGAVASVFGRTGAVVAQTGDYTKTQVGLSNVDNTTDVGKPVSTAQATADAAVASAAASALASHEADTTAVHGITDTAQLATLTDIAGRQPLDADLTTLAGLTATTDNMIQSVASAWASRTPAQVKTALALNNVDNTSDAAKPVSTATQTALDLKAPIASPTFTGTVAGVTAAMVGAIATTLPDAKGDVLTATAADTPARLAVGSNDQVLTADSSTATGLRWATPSGGGGTDYKSGATPTTGRWYRGNYGPVGSNLTLVQNRLYAAPFRLNATTTFDRIGIDVATAAAAGGVARLGIFASDAAGALPGTLVLDAGTVAIDTTGGKTITISQALSAGVYWLAVVEQTATGAAIRGTVSYDPLVPYFTGASMFTGSTAPGGISSTGTSYTGALSGTPAIADNDNGPIIGLRAT